MLVKPLIVVISLEDEDSTYNNAHLLSVLAERDAVREATTPSQARRYLTSTTRPHAVIVTDAAMALPEYHELLIRLVQYVTEGGTVVFAGGYSSAYHHSRFETMFRAWGLPWRASPLSSGDSVLNPLVKGISTKNLVPRYLSKAPRVKNVPPGNAVYLYPSIARSLKSDSSSPQPTYETPAAFAKVGRGRVGYVGDVNVDRPTINLILAMCFWPGSRAPLAPGNGVPEQSFTGLAFVEDSQNIPSQVGAPGPVEIPKRNILIISLEREQYMDDIYLQFYRALRKNANVIEIEERRAVQYALSSSPRPDAVILSDPTAAKPKHKKILRSLIEYAQSGGTVVLGLQFSNRIQLGQVRPFFARWGIPWDKGSYHRTTTTLNPSGIPAPLDKDALLPSVSMKSVHVKNAPRDHAVYLPTPDSHIESLVFAPEPVTGEQAEESPAVFARIGEGYLGYVGDVNGEQGSTRLILEMCGVKIKAGDLGPRTFSPGLTINPDGSTEPITETEEEFPLPTPALPLPSPRAPRLREAEVAQRAEARAKVREDKCTRADALKNEGNQLFRTEKWAEAAEKYRAAALLAGPQPVYLSNLAACLLKLELWELADSAASRALTHDPKHVKALYRRALARKELERFGVAMADLQRLLAIDRNNGPAREEMEDVRGLLELDEYVEWPEDMLLRSRSQPPTAMEIEDESDSEDFTHTGTRLPCRHYNKKNDGCRNGRTCLYKHAPDGKTIRDELGRNVCVYWLLGQCRFAATGNCVYAHDATYLPARGWWTDTARLERMRAEFDNAVKEKRLDVGGGRVVESILAEAFVPLPWRKDLWAVALYDVKPRPRAADYDYEYDDDGGEDYDSEDEGMERDEFGLTEGDVQEMWEYGIKPWEDGAYEEMLSIRRALSRYC